MFRSTSVGSPTRHGFSLIELLVVISIIALLISILLPSLKQARQAAIQVNCLSKLRQLGASVHVYGQDWKQHLPVGMWDRDGDGFYETEAFEHGLIPYTAWNAEVWECPGFRVQNFAGNRGRRFIEDKNRSRHYAFRTYVPNNFRYYNPPNDMDRRWRNGLIKRDVSFKISQVESNTIVTGDYVRGVSYAAFGSTGYWDRRGVSFGLHNNKGANHVFMDGHADWVSVADVETDRDYYLWPYAYPFVFEVNMWVGNLGQFHANAAPTGRFWTPVRD